MTSNFLSELKEDLSDDEYEVLVSCNINSADELYSFAMTFPTLATLGIDLSKLSNFGARMGSGAVVAVGRSIQASGSPPNFSFGVTDSGSGNQKKGSTVPPPSGPGTPLKSLRLLDYRLATWPVRDQGGRGTCVAHALAALREHASGKVSLSPQFLYWAAKTLGGDPYPDNEGTRLEYAHAALDSHGTCEEHEWPYDGVVRPGNETHSDSVTPSAPIKSSALNHRHGSLFFKTTRNKGNADRLYQELERANAPVAISVPVFAGQTSQAFTNWNTASALVTGAIIDPPRDALVVGAHAVCVTGFVPDPTELLGGHFIFRNSWGSRWGRSASWFAPPEPGYGRISATYIDKFVWEICRLA